MLLKELLDVLEEAAPFSLQEDYDNSGLQFGHPNNEVKKALICLDITPAVITEAIRDSCDVVVSHHPLLFHGLKRITGEHYTERVLMDAIKHGINIVSVHTNLDAIKQGVSAVLADKLKLEDKVVMEPRPGLLKKLVTFCPVGAAEKVRMAIFSAGAGHIGDYDCCSYNLDGYGTFRAGETANPFVGNLNEMHTEPEVRIETIFPAYLERNIIKAMLESHPYEEVAYDIYPLANAFDGAGFGIIGHLKKPLQEKDFLNLVKDALKVPVLRHAAFTGKVVDKVAVCGGSGGFLFKRSMALGADAFVTAELKHNHFMDAAGNLLLVDAGHYETEQYAKELLAGIIQKKLINFAVLVSQVDTNPVHYF